MTPHSDRQTTVKIKKMHISVSATGVQNPKEVQRELQTILYSKLRSQELVCESCSTGFMNPKTLTVG